MQLQHNPLELHTPITPDVATLVPGLLFILRHELVNKSGIN